MSRAENLRRLSSMGFRVAGSLPTARDRALRPTLEIARRLTALKAVFFWVVATEEHVPSDLLQQHVLRDGLAQGMDDEEREILEMPRPRAHATHADTIGWRLEAMWSLAWVLGFPHQPDVVGGMIADPVAPQLLSDFTPGVEREIDDFVHRCAVRAEADVLDLEDYFYCAHNAVRSAQLGHPTVPRGFHPVLDGGCVHERRHGLSWATSPGVSWAETDLST